MKRTGIFLVATLALLERVVNTPGVPEYAKRKAQPMLAAHLRSFRLAAAMGVKIGSGSDAFSDPVTAFGPYNIHELELMQEAGLKPHEVIRAATASNADLLDLADQVGALEPGKLAGILVVRGDLAEDVKPITDPGNHAALLQGGRRIPRLKDCLPQ